jgi:hypothetical protein
MKSRRKIVRPKQVNAPAVNEGVDVGTGADVDADEMSIASLPESLIARLGEWEVLGDGASRGPDNPFADPSGESEETLREDTSSRSEQSAGHGSCARKLVEQ